MQCNYSSALQNAPLPLKGEYQPWGLTSSLRVKPVKGNVQQGKGSRSAGWLPRTQPALKGSGGRSAVLSESVRLLIVVQQVKKKKKKAENQVNVVWTVNIFNSSNLELSSGCSSNAFCSWWITWNDHRLYRGFILVAGWLHPAGWFFTLRCCKSFFLFAGPKLKSSTTEIICRIWTEETKTYWLLAMQRYVFHWLFKSS